MKIAIITRPDDRSPKIMALSLQQSLREHNVNADIFYATDMLRRLVPIGEKLRYKTNMHFRLRQKLKHLIQDIKTLKRLKEYDFIILSECIPNGYWKNYYALPELKKKTKKPLGFLEVFFLDAAPNHIEILKNNGDHLHDIYDFQLALSKVSYQKTGTNHKKFEVGLNLKELGLGLATKSKFIALIDFECEKNLTIRNEQLEVLKKLGIEYIELKGSYSISEIRELYQKSSVFFMQKYESFGLPIAENLAYGTKIFTADSSWPSAFRLNANIEYYGKGELADCFVVYDNNESLESKLIEVRDRFDQGGLSTEVFNSYVTNYPNFYSGNRDEIARFISALQNTSFSSEI